MTNMGRALYMIIILSDQYRLSLTAAIPMRGRTNRLVATVYTINEITEVNNDIGQIK
jgi:hypothetical protein